MKKTYTFTSEELQKTLVAGLTEVAFKAKSVSPEKFAAIVAAYTPEERERFDAELQRLEIAKKRQQDEFSVHEQ